MDEELVKPAFHTKTYRTCDVVRIRDRHQSFKYVEAGVYPLDMYVSQGDLVMIFSKTETKDLFQKWRNREL